MAANRPYSPYGQGCAAMDRADGLFCGRCQGWAWTSKDIHCDAHHKRLTEEEHRLEAQQSAGECEGHRSGQAYMEKSGRQSMIWRHRSSVRRVNNYLDNGI